METRGEWIRLRDEKPTCGVGVLATDGSQVLSLELCMHWNSKVGDKPHWEVVGCIDADFDINPETFTHWMKMPQLPSKEEIQHERDAAKASSDA